VVNASRQNIVEYVGYEEMDKVTKHFADLKENATLS
jgi:hypothetical protein